MSAGLPESRAPDCFAASKGGDLIQGPQLMKAAAGNCRRKILEIKGGPEGLEIFLETLPSFSPGQFGLFSRVWPHSEEGDGLRASP